YTVKTPGGRDSFDCTLLRWPGSGMPTFSILKSEPGNDSQFFTALLVLNSEFLNHSIMGSPITFSGFNAIDFNVVLNAIMAQESAPLQALQAHQRELE